MIYLLLMILVELAEGSWPFPVCGENEEYRVCGPKCPITCETLGSRECCDVVCSKGCFCKDGYLLVSEKRSRRCVAIDNCPQPGTLQFKDYEVIVFEGVDVARIIVERVNGSYGEVAVSWRTRGGSATVVQDFIGSSGNLIFPDGIVLQEIKIPIIDDLTKEPEEVFYVELFDDQNRAAISGRNAGGLKVVIKDNDMTPGYIAIETYKITVQENVGKIFIPLIRSGGTDGQIQIEFRTRDDTAVSGVDYVANTGIIIFKDGERRKTLEITILNDDSREPLETFIVEFYNAAAGYDVYNFRKLDKPLVTVVTITDDDMRPGYIEIETYEITVQENIGKIYIPLIRSGGTDGQIQIEYRTVDGTAVSKTDYVSSTGVIIFKEGEIKKTVEIIILNDQEREPLKTFIVEFYNAAAGYDVINFRKLEKPLVTVVRITDDDMAPGYIEIETYEITVQENIGKIYIPLIRSGGTDGQIQIEYRTVDGTAVSKRDYVPTAGIVIFKEGEKRKIVEITILNDQEREPLKKFIVEFYNAAAGYDVINFRKMDKPLVTVVTITDDDMTPGYIELERNEIIVQENVGKIYIPLIRSGGTDGQIQIEYRTVDRTAVSKIDYIATTGIIIFKEGENRKTVEITILNDQEREPLKTFVVEFYNAAAGYEVINFRKLEKPLVTVITITDDDMTPGYIQLLNFNITVVESDRIATVALERVDGTDGMVTVRFQTVDGTAKAGYDYESQSGLIAFNEGESVKTVYITILDDILAEPLESFRFQLLELSAGEGTINFRQISTGLTTIINIIDNDANPGYLELQSLDIVIKESARTVEVAVNRVNGSDGALRFKYHTVSGTALENSDFVPTIGEIVFGDKEVRKVISIAIVNDAVREKPESFELEIFDLTAGPGVFNYRGLSSRLATTITILDDDEAPGVFEFQLVKVTVSENIGILRLDVRRRNGSDGSVTIAWRIRGITATEGLDYRSSHGSLVFEDGVLLKTIDIEIVDDDEEEGNEEFVVGIFNPSNGGILGFNSIATVIIEDNDDSSIVRFVRREGTFNEGIIEARIPVVRERSLGRRVSVFWRIEDITTTLGKDYMIPSRPFITFEPGQSRTEIIIIIVDDNLVEKTESFDIVLYNPGQGLILGIPSRYTLQVRDNDVRETSQRIYPKVTDILTISFRSLDVRVSESDDLVRITITRSGSLIPFSVEIQTVDKTAIGGVDYEKTKGPIVFGEGETDKTFGIRILNDNDPEVDETFQVLLLAPTSGIITFGMNVVTVTIVDDDLSFGGRFEYRSNSSETQSSIKEKPTFLITCPEGLILKPCENTCPPTCDSIYGKAPCNVGNGCVKGCWCPKGFVKESEASERCVRPSECPRGVTTPERRQSSGIKGLLL